MSPVSGCFCLESSKLTESTVCRMPILYPEDTLKVEASLSKSQEGTVVLAV